MGPCTPLSTTSLISPYRADAKACISRTSSRIRARVSMASQANSPVRYRPFALPFGAPLPAAPPWSRHRVFPFDAARWHGFPARFRAPHRGASLKDKGSRLSRFMGLIAVSEDTPSLR